jgi:hypothetical protein
MLIVIPVSHADSELIEPFTLALSATGENSKHRGLVVSRPSDGKSSVDLANHLIRMRCFSKTILHLFPEEGPKGWPLGPNFYWSETVKYLGEVSNNLPWLWMELDCTPLKPGWADVLEDEYRNCGTPFLGMYGSNYFQTTSGEFVAVSKHLVGVAVYPPQVPDHSKLWDKTPLIEKAFDVTCQSEFVPLSTESTVMQHGFRTNRYTEKEGGVFIGEDLNVRPGGVRYDQPIEPSIVLHHGCEDGSLARLVSKKYQKNYTYA